MMKMKLMKIKSLLKVIEKEFADPETDQELEIALQFISLQTMIDEGCSND